MALKGSITKADFIPWDTAVNLMLKLERDKKYTMAILFGVGLFCGLRISDIRSLRWKDLLNREALIIPEKKTGKIREIKINETLKGLTSRIFKNLNIGVDSFILGNRINGDPITTQCLNRSLKQVRTDYKIKIANISCHTLRKSFGRRIWENDNYSERALILLSDIFRHSNTAITRRYLGITSEEIENIYQLL